ncbi:hypothetical protein T440DRAFT_551145 [Plenodomus tracheiphilus IPT5]|uniref:Rhodopsin domain-containing protein n=1 Tax=Plenodomus tracheiphilus IPT5 TaxID=1408161 RepID=A0A6A7BJY5_9PLEO|nr:hypothetical protein T440DRAFT_551145 [Plenodomus tracheiphilus IPT5]
MSRPSAGYTSPGSLIAICVVLPVLSILAVALRFYTRKRSKSSLKLDDWILLPALSFTIGMGVATIVGVHGHGIGYHTPPPNSDIPRGSTSPEEAMTGKVEWINLWLQPLALGCIKISVLAFYNRIFTVHRSGFLYWAINVLIVLTVAWIVAFFFALFFMCGTQFYLLWGPYYKLAMLCSNGDALVIDQALAISDFGFDVIILLLPLPRIWTLHMDVQRRLLVTAVFVLGAGALLGSILRMIVFIQVQQAIESKDLTVDGLILVTRFLFWSMFEAGLAIVAVCLPTLNWLFRRMDALTILRSVRSLISLNSNRSDNGGARSYTSATRVPEENMSTSSQLKMVNSHIVEERGKSKEYKHGRYRMADLEHVSPQTGGKGKLQKDNK